MWCTKKILKIPTRDLSENNSTNTYFTYIYLYLYVIHLVYDFRTSNKMSLRASNGRFEILVFTVSCNNYMFN